LSSCGGFTSFPGLLAKYLDVLNPKQGSKEDDSAVGDEVRARFVNVEENDLEVE